MAYGNNDKTDDLVTIEQFRITLTYPAGLSWDQIRKDLKPWVDRNEEEHLKQQRERIKASQAARK